uniref:Lacticin Z n=1 Tax=Lactococcus lactis TaxID=1358 RepID=A7M6Q0_9LACT|nr:lacticin Z [Lactococcus lactis]BAM73616.1 lacticin Z [Lactococcus lactis]
MAGFLKVVQILAKYGSKAVQWAWANKGKILDWINAGQAIDWVVEKIKQILGIK